MWLRFMEENTFISKIQIRVVSNVKANNKEKTMDPSQRANETRLTQ